MGFTPEAEEWSHRRSVVPAFFLGGAGAVLAAALALLLAFAPLGYALSLDEVRSPIEAEIPGDGPAQSDPEGPASGDVGNGGEGDDAVQDPGGSDDPPFDDVDTAPAPEESAEQLLPPEAPPTESVADQRAVQSVGYIDASGAFRQTLDGVVVSVLTEAYLTDHGNELASGWYVVSQNVTVPSSIVMRGDVHLILADGQTLRSGALVVQEPSALTVYGQTTDSAKAGTLVATSSSSGAGIGGRGSDACGIVIINGGNIRAQGATFSPGIGGGEGSRGGRFVINGGNVEARGGLIAAGIGIGAAASGRLSISINGGVVNAVGGVEGAGIGTVSS